MDLAIKDCLLANFRYTSSSGLRAVFWSHAVAGLGFTSLRQEASAHHVAQLLADRAYLGNRGAG
eukprot:2224452-Amphidinium_carterae.1